jgi:hypothetical protein
LSKKVFFLTIGHFGEREGEEEEENETFFLRKKNVEPLFFYPVKL